MVVSLTKIFKTMAKQLVHYGKLLEANMKEQGRTKGFVTKLLGCSYETLQQRIKDSKFSYDELRILTDKGLL